MLMLWEDTKLFPFRLYFVDDSPADKKMLIISSQEPNPYTDYQI